MLAGRLHDPSHRASAADAIPSDLSGTAGIVIAVR
jgi:hypothetical protein